MAYVRFVETGDPLGVRSVRIRHVQGRVQVEFIFQLGKYAALEARDQLSRQRGRFRESRLGKQPRRARLAPYLLESPLCARQLAQSFGQMAETLGARLRRGALQPCEGVLQPLALGLLSLIQGQ